MAQGVNQTKTRWVMCNKAIRVNDDDIKVKPRDISPLIIFLMVS